MGAAPQEQRQPRPILVECVFAAAAMDGASKWGHMMPSKEDAILSKILRENARKRDYGDGVPNWSVYYSAAKTELPFGAAPKVLDSAVTAKANIRTHQSQRASVFLARKSNFVEDVMSGLLDGIDESATPPPPARPSKSLASIHEPSGEPVQVSPIRALPHREFGVPLAMRSELRKVAMPEVRYPCNHVCRNEFFTKGEKPGENADVMAARYYVEVGRPFEGQCFMNTCQKARSLGKGEGWKSDIQPTNAPYRRDTTLRIAASRQLSRGGRGGGESLSRLATPASGFGFAP